MTFYSSFSSGMPDLIELSGIQSDTTYGTDGSGASVLGLVDGATYVGDNDGPGEINDTNHGGGTLNIGGTSYNIEVYSPDSEYHDPVTVTFEDGSSINVYGDSYKSDVVFLKAYNGTETKYFVLFSNSISATFPDSPITSITTSTVDFSPYGDDVKISYDHDDDITIYSAPSADGVVSGTANGDLIDTAYTGDPEGDVIDGGDAILPGETGDDDIVDAGAGADTVIAGEGNDEVYGGAGDDSLEGNAGNDVIYGDSDLGTAGGGTTTTYVRESFEWDKAPDPDCPGTVDNGDKLTTFSQDTGNVDVTFSVLSASHGTTTTFANNQQKVHSIDSGSETVDAYSSMASQNDSNGDLTSYQLEFSDAVSDVSFRINDIDGDGVVKVTAYAADGTKTTVNLTAGSKVTLLDTDGVTGADTADSKGGYAEDTSPDYSVLVDIPGPVTKIVIEHTQNGDNDSGINVTDVYFDAPVEVATEDSVRESFEWDLAPDPNGPAPIEDQDPLNSTFTQNTGNVDVTFSIESQSSGTQTEFSTDTQAVGGIGDGTETIDAHSSLDSVLTGAGTSATYALDFSKEVGDVSFRVNDIDGDGIITVTAYDADNNPVTVQLDAGSSLTQTGPNTVDSNGGYSDDNNPAYSVLVTIAGPVSRIEIEHSQDGPNTSGINITDVYFDVPLGDPDADAGNDTILGGLGDDVIYGEGADDTIVLEDNFGNDSILGGETAETNGDTLDATEVTQDTTVILENPEKGTISNGTDTANFDEIENILLGSGDDTVTGSSGNDSIDAGEGSDVLDMGAGDDVVSLGTDSDGTPDDDADTYVFSDGDGNDTLVDFDLYITNPDGSLTGVDQLDVSNLTTDGTTPVNTDNVTVTDTNGDGTGDAILTFPNGESITLVGITPDLVDSAEELHAIGIPLPPFAGDGIVQGTTGDDLIDVAYTDDPHGDMIDANDAILPGEVGDDDIVQAGDGNDTVIAGAGNDEVYGEAGDDSLSGGAGNNVLYGGAGDDTFVGGDGADSFSGGAGQDNLDYSASGAGVNVNLSTGTLSGGDADNDSILGGIDGAIGSEFDDTLTGFDHSGSDPADTFTNEFFGNGGNDSISGLGANDYLDGGADNDTIDGGSGDDTILGGTGSDVITGGTGADSIDGGADDDNIETGAGDTATGGAGDDVFTVDETDPGTGTITIIGGETSEDLTDPTNGGDGDKLDLANQTADLTVTFSGPEAGLVTGLPVDVDFAEIEQIATGSGDDTVTGSAGSENVDTGAGDDVIDAGANDGAADIIRGGDDADTITGAGAGDSVYGGSGGDDNDTLDLRGTAVPGGYFVINPQTTDSDGNGFDGTVDYFDGSGALTGTLTYENIENIIPCFTPGSLIATPKGERQVEDLREGDKIITRDDGIQEIRWVGRRDLNGSELMQDNKLRPILIRAGALGNGLPERDMLVSPQHRVLVANDHAALYFEDREVLVAAKHLVGMDGVEKFDTLSVSYIHFMFDRHQVVLSDGAWTESFQPGDMTLGGMGNAQRNEIFNLFPELKTEAGLKDYNAARKTLKKHEAQLLMLG